LVSINNREVVPDTVEKDLCEIKVGPQLSVAKGIVDIGAIKT
jgi:hypothetical protein